MNSGTHGHELATAPTAPTANTGSTSPLASAAKAIGLLRTFERHAAASATPSSVWSLLTDHILAITNASRSAVLRRNWDGLPLVSASRGLSPAFRGWIETGMHGLKEASGGGTRIIADVMAETTLNGARSQLLAEGLRGVTLISLPPAAGTSVIVLLGYDRPTSESPESLATAELLAAIAASHASRARAERDAAAIAKLAEERGGQAFECVRGEQWSFRNVSAGLAEFLGHPRQDLETGRIGLSAVKHADDIDRCVFEHSRAAASGAERLLIEYRIVRGDGRVVRVREEARIVESDARGPSRIVGFLVPEDETSGPASADEAVDVEPVFLRFPMGACDIDPKGVIVRANCALTEMLGVPAQSLDGTTVDTLLHPDDLPKFSAILTESFQGGVTAIREAQRWRRRDGTFAHVLFCASPTVQKHGGSPVLRCVVHDRGDTERLRLSEEKLRGFIEQAAVGIGEIGLDGRFTAANPRLCEILGQDARDLIGMDWRKVSAPADVARCENKIAELAAGQTSHFSLEKRYVRRDGSLIWGVVTASALRDADGRLSRVGVVLQDATDRLSRAEQLGSAAMAGRAVTRVLLIDDEPAVRNTLLAMLEQDGFDATAASGVREAREAFSREEEFDVVLCDVGLRDGDGFAFAQELAATSPTFRIILMSGADAPEIPGGPPMLRKPFGIEELTRAVLTASGFKGAQSS